MKRKALTFLNQWLASDERKPLVIRGARQVGKTWLVRHIAEIHGRKLIEINFEKNPQLSTLFISNDPSQIVLNLSATFNETIDPKKSLLFFDEIQASPELLAKLRWFAEEAPNLPVIAAGSLLEFVLDEHSFSMPVGRINYLYLEPLSFEEFLIAIDKQGLVDYIANYQWTTDIPLALHQETIKCFRDYLIIGGMPAAVSSWVKNKSLQEVNQIHHNLMATYRDDFSKYSGRIALDRLEEVIRTVPRQLGDKFVYAKVNPKVHTDTVKQSLDLLCKAKLCHRIVGCAANGIPLEAELLEKHLKVIFLDVGLCSAALGLSLDQIYDSDELVLINNGGIAEQVVGQILRTIFPFYIDPSLYYWLREEKGSSAEVDFVIQHKNQVIPIEVKAGSTGSLKSLHLFMGIKDLSRAIRINTAPPSRQKLKVHNHRGEPVEYMLLSLPFYLLGQLHRLLG